ncbi:hypothetical protein M0804_003300 [Polistes exclamans]|nr:hypothetical protein M0804_003300 [Polistes exclamans]
MPENQPNHQKYLHPYQSIKITRLLKSSNASFHTFQLKQEWSFRVILCNVHHSVDLDDLKNELQELGHERTCSPVIINGAVIPTKDSVKYLGMVLNKRLIWRQQTPIQNNLSKEKNKKAILVHWQNI